MRLFGALNPGASLVAGPGEFQGTVVLKGNPFNPPVLTVSRAGTGAGTVKGGGISCPKICSHRYAYGTSITLTATPAAGSHFLGWHGACGGTGSCHLRMSADRSVVAATPSSSALSTAPAPTQSQPATRSRSRRAVDALLRGGLPLAKPAAATARSGNDLETSRGNQRQRKPRLTAPNRGISRESVASGNQPQDPNPPYKQEVAGSSPAPPMGARPVLA